METIYALYLLILLLLGYHYHKKSNDDNDDDDNDNDDDKQEKQERASARRQRRERSVPRQTVTKENAETNADVELKVLCLDRSGSMCTFGSEIKQGVDSYFKEVYEHASNCRYSVVTFDDIIETPIGNAQLSATSVLQESWITPRGSTALRDGILAAIETAQDMVDTGSSVDSSQTTSVEIVIFTDGAENSSSNISQPDLTALIKKKKKEGWTFTFLAANQDAIATGAGYGFDPGRSLTSSAGHQRTTWKRAASKRKFTKSTRKKCVSKKDRIYLN